MPIKIKVRQIAISIYFLLFANHYDFIYNSKDKCTTLITLKKTTLKSKAYSIVIFLLLPAIMFAQKASWQKTSTGRSIFTEKQINNPLSAATKTNLKDYEDLNPKLVSGAVYYIRSYEPWDGNNITLLNQAFGSGNYIVSDYTIDPATLFSSGTSVVYLEGSDATNPVSLNLFLSVNMTLAENWVNAGGHLFLNAAPNEGSSIDFGFGGTVLNYPSFSYTGTIVSGQERHPIFNGPYTPVGTSWSAGYFSHGSISGGASTPLITGTSGTILSELRYGGGFVLFGGLTTANFHSPQPYANNLRTNIYSYLLTGDGGCGAPFNLGVAKVSDDSAKLTWSAPFNLPKSFKIFYRVVGTENIEYTRKAGTETKIRLSGLIPNTTYEWGIRSICDEGKSFIVQGPNFTTLTLEEITNNIKLFPNPVKNSLLIDGLSATHQSKLTIFNLSGNAMLVATVNTKTFQWTVSNLKPGNYLLKIETNNNTISRWFVKE